jgi:hypothetical protein
MHAVMGLVARAAAAGIGAGVILAIASAVPRAAAQPPGFPSLDTFAAVPADGYATPASAGASPRIRFSVSPTLACDFYGGPAPAPQPSQDVKCSGDMPGMDDVALPGGAHTRAGDCVVGAVSFQGPGYQLSRMSDGGCQANPAVGSAGKTLNAGQKLTYLNVTCAVGADNLVACLDATSGDHGFVLQRAGSWAF